MPGLFDHYRSFRPLPAAYFGVPVVRRPSGHVATVAGGGLVASGPAGHDRLPVPWAPPGLHLTTLEGAGEVQTPLAGPGASALLVGELVWFRHAKSGEVAEHVAGGAPAARQRDRRERADLPRHGARLVSARTAAVVVAWVLAAEPTLGKGRLVCVDGPAGAGKTTLADALVDRPRRGRVPRCSWCTWTTCTPAGRG